MDVATAMFADRGYDGVSVRDLAAAVDLNVATVHHHAGGKARLYEDVIARLSRREARAIARIGEDHLDEVALRDPARVGDALRAALDAYIDLLVADPSAPALWMRCWLDAPGDLEHLWVRYASPLYRAVAERLDVGVRAGTLRDVDTTLLLRTVVWATHGYLTGGVPGTDGGADPRDPDRLATFRAFLHDLVLRTALAAPEAAGGQGR